MRPLILAFRRGLLKAGYTFGLSSRLRELMVTDLLQMEEVANSRESSTFLSAMMLGPNVDRKKYSEVMEEYYRALGYVSDLRRYNLYSEREKKRHYAKVYRQLMKDFRQMQKDGTIAAFENAVKEKYKELGIEE